MAAMKNEATAMPMPVRTYLPLEARKLERATVFRDVLVRLDIVDMRLFPLLLERADLYPSSCPIACSTASCVGFSISPAIAPSLKTPHDQHTKQHAHHG